MAVAVLLGGAVSCRDDLAGPRSVTFENRLDEQLVVYLDDRFEGELEPSTTLRVAMFIRGPNTIQHLDARTRDGRIVYQRDISGKILQAEEWRIVITDQTLTPTPEGRTLPGLSAPV